MKNLKLRILLAFTLMLALPLAVQAYSVAHGDALYVAKDQTIEGNYYAVGQNIAIDGHVTGDVYCAGQSVTVNGTVDGDVLCAGQNVSVSGKVGGSIRTAGSNVDLRGDVARGVIVVGANINVEKDVDIAWDAVIAGANVQMRGNVGRSLVGGGASYILDGKVEKNADIYLSRNDGKPALLTLTDSAVINGNLMYQSETDASISAKAQVKGETKHNLPTMPQRNARREGGIFGSFLIALLSALAFGFVFVYVWNNVVKEVADNMAMKFWPTVGWGALVVIFVPLVAVLLALTIIGWRLAFLMISIWTIALIVSKILAGISIGRLLLNKYWTAKKDSMNWAAAVGITASWIVFYIPIIGWLACTVATWWGAGALMLKVKSVRDKVAANPNTLF